MKHCILVKFNDQVDRQNMDRLCDEIQSVFEPLLDMEGIYSVELVSNVVDRPNRYDLLIQIGMEMDALEAYDESAPHKQWKKQYGDLLEKKAIFDFEEE